MEFRARLRTKSRELSHFKSLVVFVFAVYGILVPLWFSFHGNKLLGNSSDEWRTVVHTSTRFAHRHLGKNGDFPTKRRLRIAIKRPSKRSVTLPKPLRSFYVSPMGRQSRKTDARTYRSAGRLLSMKWEHLCCQTINCLRKFPLFPLLPSKTKFIRSLKLSEDGRLYGLRISGLLRSKETGLYSFYMKCLSTCEFWLSENEYPLRSKLMQKTVRGIPMKHNFQLNDSSTPVIFKARLQAGRVYFMDILLTVHKYTKYPFEILCKRPSKNRFETMTKNFFAGFQKKPESLANLLNLYAHSPSVKMTSFLESIEEPGDDDDDYTILDDKTDANMNDSIFLDSYFGQHDFSKFPLARNVFPWVEECPNKPLFLKNMTLGRYAGVWKTHFSSVFPRDRTGYMMCIGNRYPVDCLGNKVIPRETVSKFLTFYHKELNSSKVSRTLAGKNDTQGQVHQGSLTLQRLVKIQINIDAENGSLILVDSVLKDPHTNSTYFDSKYLYMDRDHSSLCFPQGYHIKWDVTINIVLVAKKQTSWLRHFLRNMEDIYLKTKDKYINVIIAKYGNDVEELIEEYQRNHLPRIRTVQLRGKFDKRKAINSAVRKIEDQDSIIFLMDLHVIIPETIIHLVRKNTIQGQIVFNPVLFRLSHCGSPASTKKPSRGFWETFGYGILGIYKSDWLKLGKNKNSKKYKKGWGGEDWELLDRILIAGLGVQRLRVSNFYHFHHSKEGMWN